MKISFDFEISKIINEEGIEFNLKEGEKRNLIQLFEFCQYLFDEDENLTKTNNLNKNARENVISRMEELFEMGLKDISSDDMNNLMSEDNKEDFI